MRVERGRTKKLTVAFHFHRAETARDRAGWNCEQCRRQGLESKRRCGFLSEERRGPKKLVWVRGRIGTEECPKSLITPESLEFVERFYAWQLSGKQGFQNLVARDAEAFLLLDAEMRTELANGEQ